MRLCVEEIYLKSGNINEDMLLPRYYDKGIWYNGEFYNRCGHIKDIIPKKALFQLKELVKIGSKIPFTSKTSVKNWIKEQTEINYCSIVI